MAAVYKIYSIIVTLIKIAAAANLPRRQFFVSGGLPHSFVRAKAKVR